MNRLTLHPTLFPWGVLLTLIALAAEWALPALLAPTSLAGALVAVLLLALVVYALLHPPRNA